MGNFVNFSDYQNENQPYMQQQEQAQQDKLTQYNQQQDQSLQNMSQPFVQDARDAAAQGQPAPDVTSYIDYQNAQQANKGYAAAADDWNKRTGAGQNWLDQSLYASDPRAAQVKNQGDNGNNWQGETGDLQNRANVAGQQKADWNAYLDQTAATRAAQEKDAADKAASRGAYKPEGQRDENYYMGQPEAQAFIADAKKRFNDWGEYARVQLMGALNPHATLYGGYQGIYSKTGGGAAWGNPMQSDQSGQDQAEQDRIYRKFHDKLADYTNKYGSDVNRWRDNADAWKTLNDYYSETHGGQASGW